MSASSSETKWRLIEETDRGTFFYPENPTHLPRFERRTPGGGVLIDDVQAGWVIRSEWYSEADLASRLPKGKKLGDRGIMSRQKANRPYFVFEYQDQYDSADILVSSHLRLISAFVGQVLIQQVEVQ